MEGVELASEFVSRMLEFSLVCNLLIIYILSIFDRFVAPTRARWFALHGFGNLLVVITGFNGMVSSLRDPLYSLDSRVYFDRSLFGSASPWPAYIINSLHVYHILFFDLNRQELFHHLVFVPIIGFTGQYFEWGCALGFMAFFISGLPGAVDYLLLVLVKFGKIEPITQKRVCAAMNVYVRGPFIIISAHTIYLAMLYDNLTVPKSVCTAILCVSLFNSLYYTKQSVANWAISTVVDSVLESVIDVTGVEINAWRERALRVSATTQSAVS